MVKESFRNRFHESSTRIRVTDVAKLAGCAPATVSRVLNNPTKVSADKRKRVENAMRELGYVRNHAARSLRSQRSNMVGVLIPTLDYALYARMVGAANETMSSAGISTLIATFGYNLDAEESEARQLLESGAEALILVGENHRPGLFQMLQQFGVPFVCTYVSNPDSVFPTVGFNNASAAGKLAEHIAHLGHRRIAIINGLTKDNDRTEKRLRGIKDELKRHNVEIANNMIVESAYSIYAGRKACSTILSNKKQLPTAIICGNDILAIGALAECQSRGLNVPQDISVVGFDNSEFAAHANPPLTTINVPAEEMGEAAASYILGRLSDKQVLEHSLVDVELILRRSSAPPKA